MSGAKDDNAGNDAVVIYTDGACKYPQEALRKGANARGPGGWGALLKWRGNERQLFGGELNTTNNRMELLAAIRALEALKRPMRAEVHTDSQYVRNGITEWIPKWKRRKWRNADNKPVRNADLWKRLDALAAKHDVSWVWVRGHDGDPGNELADDLANWGVEEALSGGGQSDAQSDAEQSVPGQTGEGGGGGEEGIKVRGGGGG